MKYNNLTQDITIYKNESAKVALKKLDKSAQKVLIVIDKENLLLGTLSDGDIRRFILSGCGLDNDISDIYFNKPSCFKEGESSKESVKKIFLEKKIELMPVIDDRRKVLGYITWNNIFSDEEISSQKDEIDVPVVIMAGGKGSRLVPFTQLFPKALIPLGDKTILEVIIEEFKKYRINKYIISINYKGSIIESYLNAVEKDYNVEFLREDSFLGTAGSLKMLENRPDETFIISNCDIIVKANYSDVLDFHKRHNASLTIVSSIQHYRIPYGVVSFKDGGEVTEIVEKPEYTFTVNTGVYVLDRSVTEYIPSNTYFDMPHLIKILLEKNKKIMTYPVNESDYVDIGQWAEYKKAIEKFSII